MNTRRGFLAFLCGLPLALVSGNKMRADKCLQGEAEEAAREIFRQWSPLWGFGPPRQGRKVRPKVLIVQKRHEAAARRILAETDK